MQLRMFNMRRSIIILLLLVPTFFISGKLLAGSGKAVAKVKVISPETHKYNIGDTLNVIIMIKLPKEICLEGMKFTKVFASGMDIISEKNWKPVKPGFWKKKLKLVFNNHNNQFGQLTIYRKADKGSLIHKEKFYLQ